MKKVKQEVKIDVGDIDIIKKLRENKAVLLGSSKEITTRYDTEDRRFENSGKYIRVMEGFKNCITIKEKTSESDTLFVRDEFEIEIDDVENAKIILEKIELLPILRMEKYRLKWNLNGIRLNLDELPFGIYIEIHGNEKDVKSAMEILKIQNKEKIIGTYWDIYSEYKTKNDLKDDNITFSNGYNYRLM